MADQQMAAYAKGPFDVPGQIQGQLSPYGACDAQFRDAASALLTYRFSTGYFAFTYAAGTPNTITIAADTEIELFVAGVDESGTDQGKPSGSGNLSESETDCYKEGAPVEKGQMFVAIGMTAAVLRPHYFVASSAVKLYAPELDEYEARIREAVLMGIGIEFIYGNTACRYRLGVLGHWSQMSGPSGSGVVSNGSPVAGAFMPFRAATVINARDESRKLTVKLKNGNDAIRVSENGSAAISTTNSVYAPVQVQLIGFPICAQDASACGIPGADGDKTQEIVAAVLRQLGR
jgi:hypothetical protein